MSNETYIKVNQESADKVTRELQRKKLPTDLDSFISLVNQGLINARNDSIKKILNLITAAYSNIDTRGNLIYIKSLDEVAIEQSEFFIKQYKLIATLQRIANEMLDEEYSKDTKLILKQATPGAIYLEPEDDLVTDENDLIASMTTTNNSKPEFFDEKDLELYDGAERFTGAKTAVASNIFLKELIKDYGPSGTMGYVTIDEIVKLSTKPVLHLRSFVQETVDETTKE